MDILIKNAMIFTVNNCNDILSSSDIAVENGVIKKIGKISEKFHHEKIIDATNQIALPGLVNAHTHISMSLFRNYADDMSFWPWLHERIKPLEDQLNADHVFWGAKLSILELIKSGVTCFSDMYFFMNNVAEAVKESGIRACLSSCLLYTSDAADE